MDFGGGGEPSYRDMSDSEYEGGSGAGGVAAAVAAAAAAALEAPIKAGGAVAAVAGCWLLTRVRARTVRDHVIE